MSDGVKKIAVVSPSGKRGFLPESDLDGALEQGFRVETAEEQAEREGEAKYGDRGVEAFAAGVGRGATFGLSDVALSKTGLVDHETLAGLQKHNEGASIAGDVVGTVAPMLIPGVGALSAGSLAARAGTAGAKVAGRLGAGKIAARAVAGAIEGGMFGVGSAISEDVLEDGNLDLTAQKLASHVGMGAILGGGGNAAGAALETAFGKFAGKAAKAADEVAPHAESSGAAALMGDGAEEAAGKPGRFGVDIEDLPDDAALSAAVKRHAPTIKGVLEQLGLEFPTAEKFVLRDLDLTGAQVGKLRAKGVEKSAARAVLDDTRYANAKTLDEKLALIRGKQSEAAEAIGESVSKFDELAQEGQRFNPVEVASRIDDEVIEPLKRGTAQNEPIIERLRSESKRLRQLSQQNGGDLSFRQAEELKRSFDPFLRWDSAEPGAAKDALRKVRGIINGEIEDKVEALAIGNNSLSHFDDWKAAKRLYGEMTELEKHTASRAAARDGNRYFSLTDYLSGNVGASIGAGIAGVSALSDGDIGIGDVALAGAGMLGNKWARERLSHVMALYLDGLAKSKGMQVAAKGFLKQFRLAEKQATEVAAVATAPVAAAEAATAGAAVAGAVAAAGPSEAAGFFSKYGAVLGTAANKGANALFATHAALASADPEYREQMKAVGFMPDAPEAARMNLQKADRLSAIGDTAAEHDAEVDKAISKFLSGKGGGGLSSITASRTPFGDGKASKDRLENFKRRLDELGQLAGNPEALTQKLQMGGTLTEAAPGVASALAMTAARAAHFLHERAPKNPHPPAIPGLEKPWQPSDTELSRWERYAAAIHNPKSVIEDMQRGSVSREAVEALRAVYPELASDVQVRLTQAIATGKAKLSYQQRLTLSAVFGMPLESSLTPQALAQLQQGVNAPPAQQKPPTTGQRIRLTDSATASQRVETRGKQ